MDRVKEFLRLPDDIGIDGAGVRVAVLDTGVDTGHADLQACLSAESESLVLLDTRLIDEVGHGTHVAGIIAGSGEASGGLYRGIAPAAEIVALRVGTTDVAFSDTVARAVERAIELGVDVINYSAGALPPPVGPAPWVWSAKRRALDRAFKAATDAGILCIAAAGNEGPNEGSVVPPGIYEEILCVGSIGVDGSIADGSSRGPAFLDPTMRRGEIRRRDTMQPGPEVPHPAPDLVAPGGLFSRAPAGPYQQALQAQGLLPDGVISCRARLGRYPGLPDDRHDSAYTQIPGTSMAAAIVSGLSALAIQYGRAVGLEWGDDRAGALRRVLCKSSQPLARGTAEDFGNGALVWPNLAGMIEDCARDEMQRERVFRKPQLRVLDD